MSKELPYFRFTVAEWLQDDISMESYELKGVFMDICAWYWFKDCSITLAMLNKRFRDASKSIDVLLELGIIKTESSDFVVRINFLDDQYDILSEKRKKYVKAGKAGGLKRASNAKATLKQRSSYKDKDNNKDNNKEKEKIEKFTPPTIEEIISYCKERDNKVDPQRFIDFYEAKGWMIGKNKIKNWKAAVRTWEKGEDKPADRNQTPTSKHYQQNTSQFP